MKRGILLLIIPIFLFSSIIPDIYEYQPITGDRLDIYLIDNTTLRSFSYSADIDYNETLILRALDLQRKSPMIREEGESGLRHEYLSWKLLSTKNLTLGELSQKINNIYKEEYDIDTVFVSIGQFGNSNNVTLAIGTGETYNLRFFWGKTYKYYLDFVEARHSSVESEKTGEIFVLHKGSSKYDTVNLYDIASPQDQIFLYPHFIYINGHVGNPGVYPYSPGFKLIDYIGIAGGIANSGSSSKIVVYNENGKRISNNDKIKPGYTISIGESFMNKVQKLSSIMTIVLGIYSIFSISTSLF